MTGATLNLLVTRFFHMEFLRKKESELMKFSFWWNEVRLVIAALSLVFGATPIIFSLGLYGFSGLYTIAAVISGLVGAYLLYMWYQGGMKLFGGKDRTDLIAFLIATLSGVHLGIGALLSTNIIMTLLSPISFLLTLAIYAGGILYLWSAWHLYNRHIKEGKRLF